MKLAICTIARLENRYIREYVEYYYNMGCFSKIYLYDNNEINGEDFRDVIGDYIDSEFVELIDYREGHKFTKVVLEAFTDCYTKHGHEYDWICFFDPDEYLIVNGSFTQYLSRSIFDTYDMIHINWLNYDDNDLLHYDDRPLLERFTRPCKNIYDLDDNKLVKTVIRGGLSNVVFTSPHTPNKYTNDFRVCNTDGTEEINDIRTQCSHYDNAYLKHFRCKTIEEYCDNKIPKLTLAGYTNILFDDEFFFIYNNWTKEKQDIFDSYKEKYNIINIDYTYVDNIELTTDIPKYSVITTIIGDIELYPLHEVNNPNKDIKYICITDNYNLTSETWEIHYIEEYSQLNDLNTIGLFKYVKFHPFEFCETDYAVYIDSKIEISEDFTEALFVPFVKSNKIVGYMQHPQRDDVYKELHQWVYTRNFPMDLAEKIITLYTNNDFYSKTLFFCSCIFYKKSVDTLAINDVIWHMLKHFSYNDDVCKSDQVIVPYAICKLNVQNYIFIYSADIIESKYMYRFWTTHMPAYRHYSKLLKLYVCFDKYIKPYSVN